MNHFIIKKSLERRIGLYYRYWLIALIVVLVSQWLHPLSSYGQNHYPPAVATVLVKAGANKSSLEKVLNFYSKKRADTLKYKAACFLIANMDIHKSYDYYWADGKKQKIPFNELDYTDFKVAVNAFDSIKKRYSGVQPIANVYRDIDSIKADFLIDNIEMAFKAWESPWAKHPGQTHLNIFKEYSF
jgi:hypothetical protein